jgi:hypothetical protein
LIHVPKTSFELLAHGEISQWNRSAASRRIKDD